MNNINCNTKLKFFLPLLIFLLTQGCASNRISKETMTSQYNALECIELASEGKKVGQKYEESRKKLSEIKSMWAHGNNDYLRMHRKTGEWERKHLEVRDRLKTIIDVIKQKNCKIYKRVVNKTVEKSSKVNITSNWLGTWASTNGINSGKVSAKITQNEKKLVGLFSIKNSPCLSSGTIEGTLSGSYAKINLISGEHEIALDVHYTSNKNLKGSYVTTKGRCKGSKGDVLLTIQN